jgi:hypothetical protein
MLVIARVLESRRAENRKRRIWGRNERLGPFSGELSGSSSVTPGESNILTLHLEEERKGIGNIRYKL